MMDHIQSLPSFTCSSCPHSSSMMDHMKEEND